MVLIEGCVCVRVLFLYLPGEGCHVGLLPPVRGLSPIYDGDGVPFVAVQ